MNRLYIDNFRTFQNFEFNPDRVCGIVGQNGSGKTTVFDVLFALKRFLGANAELARTVFSAGSLTRWDTRSRQTIEVDCTGSAGGRFSYTLAIEHDIERADAHIEERLRLDGRDLYRLVNGEVQLFGDAPTGVPRTTFPVDRRRSFLPILTPRHDNTRIMEFMSWVRGVHLFSLNPQRVPETATEEATELHPRGSNFAAWFRSLQVEQPDVVHELRDDLATVIPGFRVIRLTSAGSDERLFRLDCTQGGKPYQLYLGDLSDGQRLLLMLYCIARAIAPRSTLLVFDEPDNYVARDEIQPWLSLLREQCVASGNGTLLIISHHPDIVDYLAPDQLLRFWRTEGPSRVAAVEVHLDAGLSASEILKGSVEGG